MLNPKILNPETETRNLLKQGQGKVDPEPCTLNPKPEPKTRNPKPQASMGLGEK